MKKMKTTEDQKKLSQKKSYFGLIDYLMWWNIDKEDIQKQAKEYNQSIFHSTRGIYAMLMLGAIILTNLLLPSASQSLLGILNTLLYGVLTILILKGRKIPMILMMILFTFDKGISIYELVSSGQYSTGSVVLLVFWWSVFMRMLYVSYKVEVERLKEDHHNNKIGSKKQLNIAILIATIMAVTFFALLITKNVWPKSNNKKQMDVKLPTPIYSKEEFDRKINELQK